MALSHGAVSAQSRQWARVAVTPPRALRGTAEWGTQNEPTTSTSTLPRPIPVCMLCPSHLACVCVGIDGGQFAAQRAASPRFRASARLRTSHPGRTSCCCARSAPLAPSHPRTAHAHNGHPHRPEDDERAAKSVSRRRRLQCTTNTAGKDRTVHVVRRSMHTRLDSSFAASS